jgi:hypothetical protein
VSNPSNERFHKSVLCEVPESVRALIAPGVASIAELSARIKALDISITRMAAEKYPQTMYLQQISGIGPITSLYFVLKIETPERFKRTRDIGAFVGLCPRRDQSGETDKELRISKCGDRYLRRLLVGARNTSWDLLGLKLLCAIMADGWPRMAPPELRSERSSLLPESSPCFCSHSGNLVSPTKLFPSCLNRPDELCAPKPCTARRGRRSGNTTMRTNDSERLRKNSEGFIGESKTSNPR